MRALACRVAVFVLAGGLGMLDADEPTPGSSPEQQVAPKEQATAAEPAGVQPTIVGSVPTPAPAIAPFDAEQAKRHQEAWAKHLGVPVEVTNSIGMKLVLIPPGEFMMGTSEDERDQVCRACAARGDSAASVEFFVYPLLGCQLPKHRVRITTPLYASIYETTVQQYARMTRVDLTNAVEHAPDKVDSADADSLPVWSVSWSDAASFCERLSALCEEKMLRRRYRLPTEAEWEYICRAGTTTRFYFGDDESQLRDYEWCRDNANGRHRPVGQKKANAWGLFDMLGNASESCADWFDCDYYFNSPVNDPPGPVTGSQRVFRGGSCHYSGWLSESASREGWGVARDPDGKVRVPRGGFRVVAVLPDQQSGK